MPKKRKPRKGQRQAILDANYALVMEALSWIADTETTTEAQQSHTEALDASNNRGEA
jgi:hypothetical protein